MGNAKTPQAYGNIEPTVQYVPTANANDPLDILKNILKYTKQISDTLTYQPIGQELDLASLFGVQQANPNTGIIPAVTNSKITIPIYQPFNAIITNINEFLSSNSQILSMFFSSSQGSTPDLTFQVSANPERLPLPTRTDNQIILQIDPTTTIIAGTMYICRMTN